jgi:conjugal transfer pilus assembly protein TraE
MDYQNYQGSIGQLRQLNRYLMIALLAMSVAIAGMGLALYRAIGYKSVVLMPPVLSQQMTISDVMPDASYLQQMGLFLLSLRLNITPSNINNHFETFLSHVNSSVYGAVSVDLDKEKKAVEQGRITSAWYPYNQEINANDLSVKITGRLDKYVGNRRISNKDQTYVLAFDYTKGSLSITDYYQIEDKKE